MRRHFGQTDRHNGQYGAHSPGAEMRPSGPTTRDSWGTRIEHQAPYTSVGTGSEGIEVSHSFFRGATLPPLPRLQEDGREGHRDYASQSHRFPEAPQTWESQPVPAYNHASVGPSHGRWAREEHRFRNSEHAYPRSDELEVEDDDVRVFQGIAYSDAAVQFPTPRGSSAYDESRDQSSIAPGPSRGSSAHDESREQSTVAPGIDSSGRAHSSGPASGRSHASGKVGSRRSIAWLDYPPRLALETLPWLEERLRQASERARNGSERDVLEAWQSLLVYATAEAFQELEEAWHLDFSGERRVEERTAACLARIAKQALRKSCYSLLLPQKDSSSLSFQDFSMATRRSELQARYAELESQMAKADRRIADIAEEEALQSQSTEPDSWAAVARVRRECDDVFMNEQGAGDDLPEYAIRQAGMIKRFIMVQQASRLMVQDAEDVRVSVYARAEALANSAGAGMSAQPEIVLDASHDPAIDALLRLR